MELVNNLTIELLDHVAILPGSLWTMEPLDRKAIATLNCEAIEPWVILQREKTIGPFDNKAIGP